MTLLTIWNDSWDLVSLWLQGRNYIFGTKIKASTTVQNMSCTETENFSWENATHIIHPFIKCTMEMKIKKKCLSRKHSMKKLVLCDFALYRILFLWHFWLFFITWHEKSIKLVDRIYCRKSCFTRLWTMEFETNIFNFLV